MTKTCLLTGGSRGIGKCTAELLRGRGWEVIAPTRSKLDFQNQDDIDDWGSSAKSLDALIFCHGEWYSRSLTEQYPRHWGEQYYMRVTQPAHLIHWVLHVLEKNSGAVVMVSSTRGFIGGVYTGPYSAACAAQIALMQGYAREYKGVRFYAVCPGLTDTQMGALVKETGGARPDAIPQPPEAVARAIVACVEGEYESGAVLRVVDGVVTKARWVWE